MTSLYSPIPPLALYEIALDIQELDDIAFRHSLDLNQLKGLLENPSIKQRINALRAELQTNGAIFRAKCAVVAEDMLTEAYKKAADSDASFAVKMELLKIAAKLADLEPKPNQNLAAGAGFSITINIPQVGGAAAQSLTIEQPVEPPQSNILPPIPDFLRSLHNAPSEILDELIIEPEYA